MLKEAYSRGLQKVLGQIEQTQKVRIEQAAGMIVDAVTAGGRLHLLDTGHMLMHEGIGRVGGLMMVNPVYITVEVNNPAPKREGLQKKRAYLDGISGLPEYILQNSEIYSGDVLIVGSVSGKNILPVEVSLQAKAHGVKVIAITSVTYSSSLSPAHPSGKRLYEVADLYIDNCGVIGDALVEAEGLAAPIGPTSGVAAAYIFWCLEAEIIEQLLAKGLTPSIYKSNHLPGAADFNRINQENFQQKGY